MALVRQLLLWNLLTLPAGAVAGALLEAFGPGKGSSLYGMLTVQGFLFGGAIGLLAGTTATLTNAAFGGVLRRAGGSQALTGLIVATGVLAGGLTALNV